MVKQLVTLWIALAILLVLPTVGHAAVEIYFLRHAEVDMSNPDKPLLETGERRAELLADHLSSAPITHIFVTNYHRTADTAKPLAIAKGVDTIQVPKIGSVIKGQEVTNRSKGNVSIAPMLSALRSLPDGSTAVVIANSGNLFPIMSKYGVTQLPCDSKKCFPKKQFDNIWIVTKSEDGIVLRTEKYGN